MGCLSDICKQEGDGNGNSNDGNDNRPPNNCRGEEGSNDEE